MREDDDARFDDVSDDAEAPPSLPFPSHVAFPMPAWGMMVPWATEPDGSGEEDADDSDEEQEGGEELTEEEANKKWLRAEVGEFFTMN